MNHCFCFVSWLTCTLTILSAMPSLVQCGSNERQLYDDLLDGYQAVERPVYNESEPVNLTLGLMLQQILDVDVKRQLLIANIWLHMQWMDHHLVWNKSDYGNIEDIRIPLDTLWKPDLIMYNSGGDQFDSTYHTNIVVTHTGLCTYIPPGLFKSTCTIDVTWFPFDDQHCILKFGSWTYDKNKLSLHMQSPDGDTAAYMPNQEWFLLGVPAEHHEVLYDCCPEAYHDITYTIKLRRRTVYYLYNVIGLCLICASMSIVSFTLPTGSGEKITLGVAIMLFLMMFATMVAKMLPVSDAMPLVGIYFNAIMIMVAVSLGSTMMIVNYHNRHRDMPKMPDWVQCVFLRWLPWILGMSRTGMNTPKETLGTQNTRLELYMKERCPKSSSTNDVCLGNNKLTPAPSCMPMDQSPHAPHHHRSCGHLDVLSSIQGGHPTNYAKIRSRAVPPRPRSTHECHVDIGAHHSSAGRSIEETVSSSSSTGRNRSFTRPYEHEMSLILKAVRIITKKKIKEEADGLEVAKDWKFAATVLDRVSFIGVTMLTLTATVAVFVAAPHITDY